MDTPERIWESCRLQPLPDESELDIQDQVRSVIPPTEILFHQGRLFLSSEGVELLDRALEEGLIRNGAAKARAMRESQEGPDLILSRALVRMFLEHVINGRIPGKDVELARKRLAELDDLPGFE
jgi:hypothetical protein